MLILYVGMKFDYGKPEQGYSFEHYNFYDSLAHMGHDILYFDFMTLMQTHGKEVMNRRLLEVAKAEKPALMFTTLFTDELDPLVVREISEQNETITLNWFCDDHWRFDNFSRYWAPCFNWVVTTAQSAMPKYQKLGFEHAIKSQWACNHFLYRKLDLPLTHDITFVGQPHGNRRPLIDRLRAAGRSVTVWGNGWESGRLSQIEMIDVFNQSRVNLNLSNSSVPIKEETNGLLTALSDALPFKWKRRMLKRWAMAKAAKLTGDGDGAGNSVRYSEQIKGRNFEVPGCGGFLLTGRADNLEDYYEIDKEVVCFSDADDLVDKVEYYLSHEDERLAIAQAGYRRTLRDHTYVRRFSEIFERIGSPQKPPREVLDIGRTEEIDGGALSRTELDAHRA